LINYYWSNSY